MVVGKKRAEARCRYYVREEAKRIGWDVRHPDDGGFFLEEQEIVDFFPALRGVLGNDRPDFGILDKARQLRLIVESKNDFRLLDTAAKEAKGYADAINQTPRFNVNVVVGTAGTPDRIVQTRDFFFRGKQWVPLESHGWPLTQLPTPDELDVALSNADGTTNVQLPDSREFFDAAIKISHILRLSKIEEPLRPKVIGAIILALYQGNFSFDEGVVIEHINSNVKAAVRSVSFSEVPAERRELLARTLELGPEVNRLRPEVHKLIHQLERLNVRSIMRSGVDFLGQFYEAFLRYGCDSTKMGIVFTPRHITRYAAEILDVKLGMTGYDPASGTAGFLVAAYDRMMKSATTDSARKKARESLYGCETNATVWALAVLNMFFRGDGKSHIEYKSCFENQEAFEQKFDISLLNPPFSQEGEPEINFIDHALRCLKPGGELAVVVKSNVMVDPDLTAWRRRLVENHHVLGVISLPADLFYPIAAATVLLIVRAHSPSKEIPTLLAQITNDGYEISKRRRVEIAGSQLPQVLQLFSEFRSSKKLETIPNLACVVDRSKILDGQELCAEQWLPSSTFGLRKFEQYRLDLMRQMSLAVANYPEVMDQIISDYEDQLASGETRGRPQKRATLDHWFEVSNAKSTGFKNYPGGSVPFMSSGDDFNSIVGFVEPPLDETYDSPHITVTAFGRASIQPWCFAARGNGGSAVRVLRPRFALTFSELLWLVGQVNSQRWRFNYGRMASADRLRRLEIDQPPFNLPVISGLDKRLRDFRTGLDNLCEKESEEVALSDRFRYLALKWKSDRKPTSSIQRLIDHPSYKEIVAMGKDAVPLIIAELQKEPDHWFVALNKITGINPVPAKDRGDLVKMTEAWVKRFTK